MGYERTVKAATAAAAAGALVAVAAQFVAPTAAALVADGLPRAREAAAAWMTPPYLYLVINAIIISIAASSRFQPSSGGDRPSAAAAEPEPVQHVAGFAAVEPAAAAEPEPVQHVPGFAAVEPAAAVAVVEDVPVQVPDLVVPAVPVVEAVPAAEFVPADEPVVKRSMEAAPAPVPAMEKEKEEAEEEFSISRSSWTPRRRGSEPVVVDKDVDDEMAPPFADLTNSREKPLVSARFNRKAAKPKPSPEGSKALRVARPRKEETLESTWKAITEGRAPPLARHLRKSDTWDTRPGRRPSGSGELDAAVAAPAPPPAAPTMRKAETFNDGRSSTAPVRREPSLGQDELNRRVEAFINKFNMEMRLQRQESLKYHQEMLRLGSGRDGVY